MSNYKKLIIFVLSIFLVQNIFGLTVTEQQQQQQNINSNISENEFSFKNMVDWELVITIAGIGIVVLILILIVTWIIKKIISKIKESNRKGYDLLFKMYTEDLKKCKLNSDGKYKYRNPLTLFLTFKKAKVYAETSEGKKFIGYYDGDSIKKEEYFILALEQRHSFFKRETDIVIMPYRLKKLVFKKNDDFTLTIICEGIDEVMGSEFYSLAVFNNPEFDKYNKLFIDYSNDVLENYLQTYAYRDVIKNKILEFREQVSKAVDMNSSVQKERKTNSNLKE